MAAASQKPAVIIEESPRSAAAEAFRSLRTSLQFLGPEKTDAFVVTSPGPGEGKSTCAANLAVALARVGRHVLLVDADMRRPSIEERFRLGRVQGLSQLLVGQCGDEVIQESGIDGLEVVASGIIPPNPAELLARVALDEALVRWRAMFDHIIFDTPPVLPVTDAVVVSRKTRHALLVTRVASTRDRGLRQAVRLLREAGVDILGGIVNDIMPGHGGAYYGYYRGYAPEGTKGEERVETAMTPDV